MNLRLKTILLPVSVIALHLNLVGCSTVTHVATQSVVRRSNSDAEFVALGEQAVLRRGWGDQTEALEILREMESMRPDHAGTQFALGEVLGSPGRLFDKDASIQALKKFLSLGKEGKYLEESRRIAYEDARRQAGTYIRTLEQGRKLKVSETSTTGIESPSLSSEERAKFDSLMQEWVRSRRAGDGAQTLKLLLQMQAIKPEDAGIYFLLGELYAEEGAQFNQAKSSAALDESMRLGTGQLLDSYRQQELDPEVSQRDMIRQSGEPIRLDLGENLSMEFHWIPAGEFTMGSNAGADNEQPVHQAALPDGFWMGVTEVTQAQWKMLMGMSPSYFGGADLPVEQVSWGDAQSFCEKLSLITGHQGLVARLPTEAEWAFACRAGSTGETYNVVSNVAWSRENSEGVPHPVGLKTANALGLFDLYGNVWEWCQDWYSEGSYDDKTRPLNNPSGTMTGQQRVLRGGSWEDKAEDCRSAIRMGSNASSRFKNLGFRVVLSR